MSHHVCEPAACTCPFTLAVDCPLHGNEPAICMCS
jgi:hypothetical protein